MKRITFVLLIVIVISTLPSCAPVSTCSISRVQDTVAQFEKQVTTFEDAEAVANQTPRLAMGEQVAVMQGIRRAVQDLDTPPCLKGAKDYLIAAMDARITGWLSSMNRLTANRTVQESLDKAIPLMEGYRSEINRVTACAPQCD